MIGNAIKEILWNGKMIAGISNTVPSIKASTQWKLNIEKGVGMVEV